MITRKLLYIYVIFITFIIPHFIHASHIRVGEVIARRTSNLTSTSNEIPPALTSQNKSQTPPISPL